MNAARSLAAPTAWRGQARIGSGWAVFEGHAGDNRPHAHHALQLALGVEGPVTACIGLETLRVPALLIAADVQHVMQPGRTRLLYIERESTVGRQLSGTFAGDVRPFDATTCETLHAAWPTDRDASALLPILHVLGVTARAASVVDSRSLERMQRVIASLPHRVAEPVRLAALAAEAVLSPSRFTHCFKAITGLALRPYVRWLRLAQALAFIAEGEPLTHAAHRAGFADGAHLTRTMQRHFGVAPRDMVASLRGG